MGCVGSKNVLQNDRKKSKVCTDVLWLCLLIIFWGFLTVIAVFSIIYGNYLAVINGYDSFGNVCGVKHNKRYENFSLSGMDTSSKPYTFHLNCHEHNIQNSVKICIEECPKKYFPTADDLVDYADSNKVQLCRYDFNMSVLLELPSTQDFYMYRMGPCPVHCTETILTTRHTCVTAGREPLLEHLYLNLNSGLGIFQLFFMYTYSSWKYIAALSGIAFVMSMVLLGFICWLPKISSWFICFFMIITSTALCTEYWYILSNMLTETEDNETLDRFKSYVLDDFLINKKIIYALAILSSITTTVLTIVVIVLSLKLSRIAVLFEETRSCLIQLPELMTIPLIALLVLTVFLWFFSYIMLCMATANHPEISSIGFKDKEYTYYIKLIDDIWRTFKKMEYVPVKPLRNSWWIFFVAFIWTAEILFACEQFLLGAGVAHWYFKKPLTSTIEMLFKHHLGTVAKGSIILTLFKIPRLVLIYLCPKLKKIKSFKRWSHVFGLVENYFGEINHNAFTVVSMQAIDFIPAGRIAWKTMAGNSAQVKSMKSLADFVLFLGKLFIATATCLIGVIMLKDREDFHFYMAPVIFSSVFAFLIAHVVFSWFEIIMDNLFLCVCEDKQIHSCGGPWIRSNLSKFLQQMGTEQVPIPVVNIRSIDRQPFSTTVVP